MPLIKMEFKSNKTFFLQKMKMITRANVNDSFELSHLAKTCFYDTFKDTCTDEDMHSFLEEYYSTEVLKKELADENEQCYFYTKNKINIGYILFKEGNWAFESLKRQKAIELKRLYVLKEFHGKGVAQALINFYLDFSKSNNFKVAWLGVWEYNERAKAFYKKNGFKDTGFNHPFPIGNTPQTDLWYWRKL
jgi:diamine N-acetyltransferase